MSICTLHKRNAQVDYYILVAGFDYITVSKYFFFPTEKNVPTINFYIKYEKAIRAYLAN